MTAVSPLHSEEGRRLLDTIDRLKLLPSISHELALPQIIVVGQQSSGKSSVLKAISNIDFPTNSGFCTQFATEIICRRENIETTKAQIVPAGEVDDQYRQRLDGFSRRWSQISPEQDVADIIDSAKQVMGLNSHQRISKDKLRLEFSGPKQDHISLIDLPGLFEQNLPGQRASDKELVDEMVREYMSGKQTIILAVVSGAYDVQVQRIFGMFKPYSDRTLGIVTAPDLVESGTARAKTFSQLVANSSFKAGQGWHVLRNLSHREEQQQEDRDTVERRFFDDRTLETNNVWANVPDSRLGIKNLKTKLASMLHASIAEGLPQIQRQLRHARQSCEKELDLLGNERVTTEQQREYLADKSESLRELTIQELNGGKNMHSLRSRIRTANDRFADNMVKYGAYWDFTQKSTGAEDAVEDSDFEAPVPISDQDWLALMLTEISNSRGRELDGLVDPVWVGRMFLRQNRKWKGLAERHIDAAFAIVEQYFGEIIEKVVGKEDASRFLTHTVQPELDRRYTALKDKLAELLTPYTTEHIRTSKRNFRVRQQDLSSVLSNRSDKTALTQNMVAHYTSIMLEYYQVALNVFVDNIESLAIENVLLGGLENIMTATKAHKMSEDEVAALASESEEVTEKRQLLTIRTREYEEGSRIISRYSTRSQHSVSDKPQPITRTQCTSSTASVLPNVTVWAALDEIGLLPTLQAMPEFSFTDSLTPDNSNNPDRHGRTLNSDVSSRGSSTASRIFSEDDESLPSRNSSASSTPSKFRLSRRNKFEAVA